MTREIDLFLCQFDVDEVKINEDENLLTWIGGEDAIRFPGSVIWLGKGGVLSQLEVYKNKSKELGYCYP